MKKFLCAAIFAFSFCSASFAQNNQSVSCPNIDITGPSGIVEPGETATFTANVETSDSEKLIYHWTISTGEIVAGQGTSTITVKTPMDSTENLTVTVQIKGLPEGCENVDSESTPCGLKPPEAEKIDEFLGSVSKIENRRSKKIIKAMLDNPQATLWVIVGYKEEKTLSKNQTEKEKEISNFLVKENEISAERIVIVRNISVRELTEFWIVPAGAIPPTIDKN